MLGCMADIDKINDIGFAFDRRQANKGFNDFIFVDWPASPDNLLVLINLAIFRGAGKQAVC